MPALEPGDRNFLATSAGGPVQGAVAAGAALRVIPVAPTRRRVVTPMFSQPIPRNFPGAHLILAQVPGILGLHACNYTGVNSPVDKRSRETGDAYNTGHFRVTRAIPAGGIVLGLPGARHLGRTRR